MTVGLLFISGVSLLLGILGSFPRPSQAERDAERRSWRSSEPMSDVDRVFRQRADLLSRVAPLLLALGAIACAVAIVSAVAA